METKADHRERIGSLLAEARYNAGLSQQSLADLMGKGKRTIQNWELGVTTPNIDEMFLYFRTVGQNPTPYLKRYLYPNQEVHDTSDKRESLHNIVDNILTDEEIDILHYFLACNHGHSVYAYLQKIIADLQCNIGQCHGTAIMIQNNYQVAKDMNMLSDPNGPQPDMDAFQSAIDNGKKAYINNDNGYIVY